MAVTAYLYNSCSSCRKTEQELTDAGVDFEKREFFKQRFTAEELTELLARTGLSVRDILSTRSVPYREMNLAERDLSDDELIALMVEEPRLIRRPLIVSDDTVIVGHNAAQIRGLIEKERA